MRYIYTCFLKRQAIYWLLISMKKLLLEKLSSPFIEALKNNFFPQKYFNNNRLPLRDLDSPILVSCQKVETILISTEQEHRISIDSDDDNSNTDNVIDNNLVIEREEISSYTSSSSTESYSANLNNNIIDNDNDDVENANIPNLETESTPTSIPHQNLVNSETSQSISSLENKNPEKNSQSSMKDLSISEINSRSNHQVKMAQRLHPSKSVESTQSNNSTATVSSTTDDTISKEILELPVNDGDGGGHGDQVSNEIDISENHIIGDLQIKIDVSDSNEHSSSKLHEIDEKPIKNQLKKNGDSGVESPTNNQMNLLNLMPENGNHMENPMTSSLSASQIELPAAITSRTSPNLHFSDNNETKKEKGSISQNLNLINSEMHLQVEELNLEIERLSHKLQTKTRENQENTAANNRLKSLLDETKLNAENNLIDAENSIQLLVKKNDDLVELIDQSEVNMKSQEREIGNCRSEIRGLREELENEKKDKIDVLWG